MGHLSSANLNPPTHLRVRTDVTLAGGGIKQCIRASSSSAVGDMPSYSAPSTSSPNDSSALTFSAFSAASFASFSARNLAFAAATAASRARWRSHASTRQ